VRVHLSDGSTDEGDVLVGADGIRSRVRSQMFGAPPLEENLDKAVDPSIRDAPRYSGYTCYAAISRITPEDVEEVGYMVFLGSNQYFVSSDVGDGQQQWYAFIKQDPGMEDEGIDKKAVLMEKFRDWCPAVCDRIGAVVSEEVQRRDIYDRPPTLQWCKGRVALLGDSAHAMQPNMGQGGCQAIEDAAALAQELAKVGPDGVGRALAFYQLRRIGRASAITGFAATASIANTTYRRYLGSNPYEFYSAIPGAMNFWAAVEKLKIPHPGRIVGQIAMLGSIDLILKYITTMGDQRESVKGLLEGQKQTMRKLPDSVFEMHGPWGFAK
jgi:zeaxanthin epoxidase